MELFDPQPIIGMVHLDPLPGAPQFDGDRAAIRQRALDDARALTAGGVDAVIVENFGDAPFYPTDVPTHVVAEMTSLVGAVADVVDVPVGVNVLRNDAEAALSIAAATGASFVRINVHTGARVTDQGVLEGRAHETLRLSDRLDADVRILADVAVKHSEPLGPENVRNETRDAVERGLADAVVVSGAGTGREVPRERLDTVVAVAHECGVPAYVGSGVTHDTAAELLSIADGAIVGSALKTDGAVHAPVAHARVEALTDAVDRVDR
ncbi:BtpA/SgcQ family protein [Halocatena pleomorpha]|uniref:BtpA/SgcQ family protein n=1 Tax=Halocatena pleomorpha TaxID=1785090 RepID=A0A3P3REB6_9EURY|nr:BtpA/SgcQ family protein [Halocatena pleomorpha]RRJ31694.1 BtpA/SgcQ family protein [Halocatena pleomorpha]